MSGATHELKVVAPYFEALADGSKTFEVRRNDRGFQRGDLIRLREYDPSRCYAGYRCSDPDCPAYGRSTIREITFVYSGDPRFGGIEPGFVVLALGPAGGTPNDEFRPHLSSERVSAETIEAVERMASMPVGVDVPVRFYDEDDSAGGTP